MKDERRRFPRYAARDLRGTYDQGPGFEAITIGLGGMLLRVGEEPSLGDLAVLELDLGQETFRSPARVVFVGPDTAGGFRVGLAFENPQPGEQLRLERHIRREYE